MSAAERPDMTMHASHRVLVFIDSIDLAEVETMRYAKGLHADHLTAVHFVLDEARAARLQVRWQRFGETTSCAWSIARIGGSAPPPSSWSPRSKTTTRTAPSLSCCPAGCIRRSEGRLLHDRTADMMARLISRIPGASAQILAYDVGSKVARTLRFADGEISGRSAESTRKAQATRPTF